MKWHTGDGLIAVSSRYQRSPSASIILSGAAAVSCRCESNRPNFPSYGRVGATKPLRAKCAAVIPARAPRAEVRHDAGRMKPCVMKATLHGCTYADRSLHPNCVGGEDIGPGSVHLLADSERRRQSHYAGMNDARRMRVV